MCLEGGFWDNCVSGFSALSYCNSRSFHIYSSHLFQSIPSAWILLHEYTQEALLAGFYLLISSLVQHAFSRACAADIAAITFSSVVSIDVQPSLYDFINVSWSLLKVLIELFKVHCCEY